MQISYLSDTDSAYKELEEALLRNDFGFLHDREYHENMGSRDFEDGAVNFFFESLAALSIHDQNVGAHYKRFFPEQIELPTRLDAPLPFMLLKNVVEILGAFLGEFNGAFTIPRYACVPLGNVNAQCVEVGEQKNPFILVNSQLLTFCNTMAKGFAAAIPRLKLEKNNAHLVAPPKAVRNYLKKNVLPGQILSSALKAYCVDGDMYAATFFKTPKYASRFADLFVTEMELFVFSHEIAHLYQGHLMPSFMQYTGLQRYKIEHDADGLGFFFATTSLLKKGMALRYASIGIFLFFGALLLGERYSALLESGNDRGFVDSSTDSHPGLLSRISHLASMVEYMTNGQMKATNLNSSLISFLEEVWVAITISMSDQHDAPKK